MITQDLLHELFVLDSGTGILRNRIDRPPSKAGEIAGSLNRQGYWKIKIRNKAYYRSRIVFCMTYGHWPKMIDHKNHDRSDDRPSNLRDSSYSRNAFNRHYSTNLPRGVSDDRHRFRARIMKDRKSITLGRFSSPQEASEAYQKAAIELYGKDGLV